ncbi:DUF2793 domain-containing protein [Maricaulis sp.]|uniref:DUF2793 domain-containing protein n=1 Tax=Maricaulis sp. TaxID=1486257 RepID=UPI002620508E|nr:DUF2793 domain-containing protein [Maricaulis sp.]
MSETSSQLDLPLVMPDQAQKHVTVNEALLRLDALVQLSVESRSLSAQPAAPAQGGRWILPANASGDDWAYMTPGDIAIYRDGYWSSASPKAGWQAYVRDEGAPVIYKSGTWQAGAPAAVLAADPQGAQTRAVVITEELAALSGASVSSSAMIPDRAILLGVSVRTTAAISGASSFDCGIAGEPSKFGGALGVAEGASNIGVIGPQAFYADTAIMLSANGGDFAGGNVALAIHALLPVAPD